MPCVRIVAIKSAKPVPASQAEKVMRIIGAVENVVASVLNNHREKAMNKDSIIPSRQRRADSKCLR